MQLWSLLLLLAMPGPLYLPFQSPLSSYWSPRTQLVGFMGHFKRKVEKSIQVFQTEGI